jgi:hypothetical protein
MRIPHVFELVQGDKAHETCTCICLYSVVNGSQRRPTTIEPAGQYGESDRPALYPPHREGERLGRLGFAGSARIGWPAGTEARHDNHSHWLHVGRPELRATTPALGIGQVVSEEASSLFRATRITAGLDSDRAIFGQSSRLNRGRMKPSRLNNNLHHRGSECPAKVGM